jgi:phage gp29-like protein
MADKYDFQEIGTSGLQQTGGWIIDEFIPDLRGIRGAKIYREMSDNDPVIGAMLFAIERLILNIDWDVEPYSDKNEIVKKKDEQNAQFLRECMHDMNESWSAMLSQILSFLPYGYAYCEIVYKKRIRH